MGAGRAGRRPGRCHLPHSDVQTSSGGPYATPSLAGTSTERTAKRHPSAEENTAAILGTISW